MNKIKVMIADDHQMVIRGLRDMLQEVAHVAVIGTCETGKELMAALADNQPDVLILDIQMPELSGDEVAPIIHQKYPGVKILILTNSDQVYHTQSLLQKGALGYLLKNTDPDTLIQAIETVFNNRQFIDPYMKEKLVDEAVHGRKEDSGSFTLSRREREILQLIALEYTSQEIADKLFLSQRTVNNYRLNLLYKLDVKNTAGLVRKAISLGLVE